MDLTVSRAYARYVVISDEAIITLERRSAEELRQTSTIAFVIGGALGPILAAILERIGMPGGPMRLYLRGRDTPPLAEIRDVLTCWASEAPEELVREPDWPRVEAFRPVTFYPRSVIGSVRLSRWGGLRITLKREVARDVVVPIPAWDHGRFRGRLTRSGYLEPSPVISAATTRS